MVDLGVHFFDIFAQIDSVKLLWATISMKKPMKPFNKETNCPRTKGKL